MFNLRAFRLICVCDIWCASMRFFIPHSLFIGILKKYLLFSHANGWLVWNMYDMMMQVSPKQTTVLCVECEWAKWDFMKYEKLAATVTIWRNISRMLIDLSLEVLFACRDCWLGTYTIHWRGCRRRMWSIYMQMWSVQMIILCSRAALDVVSSGRDSWIQLMCPSHKCVDMHLMAAR